MIKSSLLSQFKNLSHGFTTKKDTKGISVDNLFTLQQIHSLDVVELTSNERSLRADGVITRCKNLAIAVKTADCVPVLLYDPKEGMIGAVHAGWKGSLGKITYLAIEKMKQMGSKPKNIHAVVGPAIGICCYDIPIERALLFEKHNGISNVLLVKDKRRFIDLPLFNKLQLVEAGLNESSIELMDACTSCHNDLYYSYRKENKSPAGSIISWIQLVS